MGEKVVIQSIIAKKRMLLPFRSLHIKLAAVIVGLAALAYLEYQRFLNVDWHKVQAISQNGIDW